MKWYGEPLENFKVKVPKSLPPYPEDAEIERHCFILLKTKNS